MFAKKNRPVFDGVCYTSDLDWASEFVILEMLRYFEELNIHPTIFVTHPSACVMEYAKQGKIDLGIHPNFVLPSSQGNSIKDIIDYCMNLLPHVKVFRCHRWYASNDIYDFLYQKGLRYDSNLCTLMDVVSPFRHRSGMISFPTFFEDGAWLYHGLSLEFKETNALFEQFGLKVINIHPMHLALNTPYFRYMRDIKDRLPRERWNSLAESDIRLLENNKIKGIRDFLQDMVNHYQSKSVREYTLKEAYCEIGGITDGYERGDNN